MIVNRGDRGDAVKAIQEKLELKADGVFGPQTEDAVKDFQDSLASARGCREKDSLDRKTWSLRPRPGSPA